MKYSSLLKSWKNSTVNEHLNANENYLTLKLIVIMLLNNKNIAYSFNY